MSTLQLSQENKNHWRLSLEEIIEIIEFPKLYTDEQNQVAHEEIVARFPNHPMNNFVQFS